MISQIVFSIIGVLLIMIPVLLGEKMFGKWKRLLWIIFILLGIGSILVAVHLAINEKNKQDHYTKKINCLVSKSEESKKILQELREEIKEVKEESRQTTNVAIQIFQTLPWNKGKEIKMAKEVEKQASITLTAISGFTAEAEVVRGLKGRAVSLSSQIAHFLIDRYRSEPALPANIYTFKEDANKFLSYFKDTMNQYSLKFGSEAVKVRNEFANKKLRDTELDNYYQHPTTPVEIRIIAERLQVLAEQIP